MGREGMPSNCHGKGGIAEGKKATGGGGGGHKCPARSRTIHKYVQWGGGTGAVLGLKSANKKGQANLIYEDYQSNL